MARLNKAILIGYLTADPELKQTAQGTSVCSFTIAVNRRNVKEGSPSCDFISCVAWRERAEFAAKYFKKGNPLLIVGEIQTRSYTDKQGSKRYVTEILVDEAGFVDHKSASGDTRPPADAPGEYNPSYIAAATAE